MDDETVVKLVDIREVPFEQRQAAFAADLQALLVRYGVRLEARPVYVREFNGSWTTRVEIAIANGK